MRGKDGECGAWSGGGRYICVQSTENDGEQTITHVLNLELRQMAVRLISYIPAG